MSIDTGSIKIHSKSCILNKFSSTHYLETFIQFIHVKYIPSLKQFPPLGNFGWHSPLHGSVVWPAQYLLWHWLSDVQVPKSGIEYTWAAQQTPHKQCPDLHWSLSPIVQLLPSGDFSWHIPWQWEELPWWQYLLVHWLCVEQLPVFGTW